MPLVEPLLSLCFRSVDLADTCCKSSNWPPQISPPLELATTIYSNLFIKNSVEGCCDSSIARDATLGEGAEGCGHRKLVGHGFISSKQVISS